MAEIVLIGKVHRWGSVATALCAGCADTFAYTPALLDSSIRGGFNGKSIGPRLSEWAARHKDCPNPREEVSASGIRVVDRRRNKNVHDD